MKPETKKYLRKRKQIINIIMTIETRYESWRNNIDVTTTPEIWEARKAAEKILAKVGVNKPEEVINKESKGFIIGV